MSGKISLANAKAVTQRHVVRFLLRREARAHLRLENGRTIITEIDHLAGRVVAEKIAFGGRLPTPSILNVMSNSSRQHFRIFAPIDGATMLLGMVVVTTGRATAVVQLLTYES